MGLVLVLVEDEVTVGRDLSEKPPRNREPDLGPVAVGLDVMNGADPEVPQVDPIPYPQILGVVEVDRHEGFVLLELPGEKETGAQKDRQPFRGAWDADRNSMFSGHMGRNTDGWDLLSGLSR